MIEKEAPVSRWHRVFGRAEKQPTPVALQEHLRGLGVDSPVHLHGDDDGWTSAEFALTADTSPLVLECFLAAEPGIRGELNTWAAWLETCDYSPHHTALMERVIQTRQLYTLRQPIDHADEVRLEKVIVGLCLWLAQATDGVYQADHAGFHAADGTLLLQEY